jgi:excisionase family DNA binding protein
MKGVKGMETLVYTVRETAKMLNIGLNKAYELIEQKQIPVIRVGRKFIVPKQALEKWLSRSIGENV